jgi:hypothetical protein
MEISGAVLPIHPGIKLCTLLFMVFLLPSAFAQAGKPAAKPTPEVLSNEEIEEARRRLNELGYWVDLNATELDASLRHALTAFQKIEGGPRTGVLSRSELERLRKASPPPMLESGEPHIEIDLFRQVLFLQSEAESPHKILPISTGSGELFTEGGVTRRAITPTGRFKITRKIEGWRKSPLGLLYYPNYFYDGIAIHGNPSVPASPASHGCVRIPMFAAKEFSQKAPVGLPVIVYDSNPLAKSKSNASSPAPAGKKVRLACN